MREVIFSALCSFGLAAIISVIWVYFLDKEIQTKKEEDGQSNSRI